VKDAVLFLEGKSHLLISNLEDRMHKEASDLNYEKAAVLRDQIRHLKEIQQKQHVVDQSGEFDVITLIQQDGMVCVGVLKIREGHLLDHAEHFPSVPEGMSSNETLSSFLSQYYLNMVPLALWPKQIVINVTFSDEESLASVLSEHSGRKIMIHSPKRGKLYEWIKWGLKNTTYALDQHLATKSSYAQQLEGLQKLLNMQSLPKRIECFDVSHSSGESTVASKVVFGLEGPIKADYRRFNIQSLKTLGDDYGAMREVLLRRYAKAQKEAFSMPDLVLVDGGRGQLNVAIEVFNKLGIENVLIVGIAKGEGRKPGLEKLWLKGLKEAIVLSSDSVVLHLLQRIRDEAHRFAILGSRHQRDKKRSRSFLEDIPGIGAKRRRLLLSRYNGLQQLKQVSVEELGSLPGFSRMLAQRLYDYLH
jgi:excinuclease ABC subunit C